MSGSLAPGQNNRTTVKGSGTAGTLQTPASSIDRALDQVGDKWCLLIIQEVFWGINSFSGMLAATGASRAVLSDRLKWLQSIDCLRKRESGGGRRGGSYHLTRKSLQLHASAMMAIAWERRYFSNPELDAIELTHSSCGQAFTPQLRCSACNKHVDGRQVSYASGPGTRQDARSKKVRRRSSLPAAQVPSAHNLYRNLIDIVGDRWTANIIALAFHGVSRFDEFHRALPVATNILSDRLRLLEEHGVFVTHAYQQRPLRMAYRMSEKGWDLFPYFLTLLHWGDRWCDEDERGPPMLLTHSVDSCGQRLHGQVVCSGCSEPLEPFTVSISL